jgi:hypothetical protein
MIEQGISSMRSKQLALYQYDTGKISSDYLEYYDPVL